MSPIVHPTDFSPSARPAFAKAVELAKKGRSQLVIAHVLPILAAVDGYGGPLHREVAAGAVHAHVHHRRRGADAVSVDGARDPRRGAGGRGQ